MYLWNKFSGLKFKLIKDRSLKWIKFYDLQRLYKNQLYNQSRCLSEYQKEDRGFVCLKQIKGGILKNVIKYGDLTQDVMGACVKLDWNNNLTS